MLDHSTFSKNRHGRFRESGLFRHLFEQVLERCFAEGLVGGESFGADASLIKADASRYAKVGFSEWSAAHVANRATQEYLDMLDDAAVGVACLSEADRDLEGRQSQPERRRDRLAICQDGGKRGSAGFDACKTVKKRKRYIVTDPPGLLFGRIVHGAGIQDRDGVPEVLKTIRRSSSWLRHILAGGGHAGPKLRGAFGRMGEWTFEGFRRVDDAEGFEALPRRWAPQPCLVPGPG